VNARLIQARLMFDGYRRHMELPNYTPLRWFECDIFEVTAAGYFREYEIKLTRSDFKADARKERRHWWDAVGPVLPKHGRLAIGDTEGPSQFWFVTPEGLVTESEIPRWAGWIVVSKNEHTSNPVFDLRYKALKRAPRLHNQKCNPKVVEHAKSVCYYRYLQLLLARQQLDPGGNPDIEPVVADVGRGVGRGGEA
jgi:hypothetical protein